VFEFLAGMMNFTVCISVVSYITYYYYWEQFCAVRKVK